MPLELRWILLCLALVTGESLGFSAAAFSSAWPAAALAAVVAALALYGFSFRHWPFVFLFLAGISLALFASESRRERLDGIFALNAGKPVRERFVVGSDLTAGEGADGKRTASFAGSLRGIPVRVMMAVGEDAALPSPGETWELDGWLEKGGDRLFGGMRRTFWVRGRGSAARLVADEPFDALVRVRTDLSRRVGLGLAASQEAAELNRAMILGERFRIPKETRLAFEDAGTVHIFAISGLHVLFIAKIFAVLLQCAFVSPRWSGLILVPLLWAYVILVGACPSAVRAAMMATVYCLAPVFWRRPNAFVSWSVAFMITYVVSPEMVFDVGCTFSFVVMLAIISWIQWTKGLDLGWMKPFGVPAAAWLAGVPIAAHVFGRITPGGLVANLFAVAFAEVSVIAGALGLMASFVSETLAAHFNNFSALATEALAALSRIVASQDWSSKDIRPWTLTECVAWYALAIILLLFLRSFLLRRKSILS